MKWEQFGLAPSLCKQLRNCGFKHPTTVQQECLKHLQSNRDMLISARTGEGKTLTYALPILNSFVSNPQEPPLALILAPTRELVMQIESHIKKIGNDLGVKTCSVVGGLAAVKQQRILEKNRPHIIVATPGRLWDLMREGNVPYLKELNKVKFMVVDEGDRMVECGHFRELHNILDYVYYEQDKPKVVKVEDVPEEENELFKEFVEQRIEPVGFPSEQMDLIKNAEDLNEEIDLSNIEKEEEEGDSEEVKEEEGKSADSGSEEESKEEEKKEKKVRKLKGKEKKRKNQFKKQTIVCSATLIFDTKGRFQHRLSKKKIKETAKDRLTEVFRRIGFNDKPVIINLTQKHKLPDELHEFYIHCTKEEKDLYLLYYLRETQTESVIIFCNSITCCKRLQSLLKMLKYSVSCLHSKMEQGQRLKNMDKFKNLHEGKTGKAVLVCTDVGARGIDIPDVNHVVHYQLPKYAEIYIHRCGRTARIYKEGNTLALVGPDDEKNFKAIATIVRKQPKGEAKEDETEIAGAKKYEVNYVKLSSMKKMVDKAVELESTLHQQKKKRAEGQWLLKMANEAEIELDQNFVKENKRALDTCQEPVKKKKEQIKIKRIQQEYEQEYEAASMGTFSRSSFLSPELVTKLNQIASQKGGKTEEKQVKRHKKLKNKRK